jgi:hypothetical protein
LLFGVATGMATPALATNLLLDESRAICAVNHADPAKALAAADSSGWVHPKNGGPGFVQASPWWRVKFLGGQTPGGQAPPDVVPDFLMLKVKDEFVDGPLGKLRVLDCSITGSRFTAGLAETGAAAQEYLGRDPQMQKGPLAVWMYQDIQPGRSFFGDAAEANQTLSVGSVIVIMSVFEASNSVTVDYREVSLSKPE